jgi:hypothetical protein
MFLPSKRRQYNFGLAKLDEKLDTIFIVKKLTEIDKLKAILLSES